MNDRELLELAAKAAGVGGGWGDRFEYHNGAVDLSDMWILDQEEFCPWNPLIDDGDALRLAVIINEVRVFIYEDEVSMGALGIVEQHDGSKQGKQEATRRAIVRAAAEIGKSL